MRTTFQIKAFDCERNLRPDLNGALFAWLNFLVENYTSKAKKREWKAVPIIPKAFGIGIGAQNHLKLCIFGFMKRKVLLIYTGGTIGMEKDYETGSLRAFDFGNIFQKLPEMKLIECEISVHPFKKSFVF